MVVEVSTQLDVQAARPSPVHERRDFAYGGNRRRHAGLLVAAKQGDRAAKFPDAAKFPGCWPADLLGRAKGLLGGD